MSIEQDFKEVYMRFKLHFYRELFGNWSEQVTPLTTVETFCMEVIYAMDRPTINEFANFIKISQPNAAYKVNNLIRKGFLRKVRSEKDKREYFLEVTDKYLEYLNIGEAYFHRILDRMEERFSPEQIAELKTMMNIFTNELMPEVPEYRKRRRDE